MNFGNRSVAAPAQDRPSGSKGRAPVAGRRLRPIRVTRIGPTRWRRWPLWSRTTGRFAPEYAPERGTAHREHADLRKIV